MILEGVQRITMNVNSAKSRATFGMLVMAFTVSCGILHQEAGRNEMTIEDAKQRILTTDTWIAGARYGFSGQKENMAGYAIYVIAQQSNAPSIFNQLLSDSALPGQLYALCGLYRTDKRHFDRRVGAYLDMTNEVRSIHADVVVSERVCDIVRTPKQSKASALRVVLGAGETLDEWVKKNVRGEVQGYYIDICGGAYPSIFLD